MTFEKWLTQLVSHMVDSNDMWRPEAVVEIEPTEERSRGYESYPHCHIKDDKDRKLYLLMEKEEPFGHYYVWQTTGYCGDDFSGWLLFPLPRGGKYLKVSYSC